MALPWIRRSAYAIPLAAGLALAFSPALALAANVTLTAATTVVLPSNGGSYTLSSGGTFDTLVVSGGTMVFTMTSGESVTITAPGSDILDTGGAFQFDCSANSTVTLAPTSATTITVSPYGSCLSSGSGAGGAGGGGGSVSAAPAASSPSVPTTATTATTAATTPAAARAPVNGLTESQVASILTLMRAFNADQSVIDAVDAALHGETVASAASAFSKNLTLGSKGAEVAALQRYLNAHGVRINAQGAGAPGHESEFFGALTKAALAKFQKLSGISPASGYFGPLTRAFLAAHP